MNSSSLSAFRDFCAAKPEAERYVVTALTNPVDEFLFLDLPHAQALTLKQIERLWNPAYEKPRTYGALTARLDALLGAAS